MKMLFCLMIRLLCFISFYSFLFFSYLSQFTNFCFHRETITSRSYWLWRKVHFLIFLLLNDILSICLSFSLSLGSMTHYSSKFFLSCVKINVPITPGSPTINTFFRGNVHSNINALFSNARWNIFRLSNKISNAICALLTIQKLILTPIAVIDK